MWGREEIRGGWQKEGNLSCCREATCEGSHLSLLDLTSRRSCRGRYGGCQHRVHGQHRGGGRPQQPPASKSESGSGAPGRTAHSPVRRGGLPHSAALAGANEQLSVWIKRFAVSPPSLSFPATLPTSVPAPVLPPIALLRSRLCLSLLLPAPPTHLRPHVLSVAVASGAFLLPTRPGHFPSWALSLKHTTEGLLGEVAGPRARSGECPLGKPKRVGAARAGVTVNEASFHKRKLWRAA